MLINHRQSSTAFICFLLGENSLAFGVHRPMAPSSIKIVCKLVELTEQYRLILHCGYCSSIPENGTNSEGIAQTLLFYAISARNKTTQMTTRGCVPKIKGTGTVVQFQPDHFSSTYEHMENDHQKNRMGSLFMRCCGPYFLSRPARHPRSLITSQVLLLF